MIDWDKPLECDLGEVTVNRDGDHAGLIDVHLAIESDNRISWWAHSHMGTPFNSGLGDKFNIRNAISRKDKILAEILAIADTEFTTNGDEALKLDLFEYQCPE